MGIIYKHTIDDESYIGYTVNTIDQRLKQHLRAIEKGVNTHFYNKVRKSKISSKRKQQTTNNKPQMSNMHKGKIIIHHLETEKCKMVLEKDFINTYKEIGYIRGRK